VWFSVHKASEPCLSAHGLKGKRKKVGGGSGDGGFKLSKQSKKDLTSSVRVCPAATSAAVVVVVGAQLIATKWHQMALINSLQMGWGMALQAKGGLLGGRSGRGYYESHHCRSGILELWVLAKRNIILR